LGISGGITRGVTYVVMLNGSSVPPGTGSGEGGIKGFAPITELTGNARVKTIAINTRVYNSFFIDSSFLLKCLQLVFA
jgi:hypothetical protein